MSLADDLLDDARQLAHKGVADHRASSMRRAVSTAYYAVFHLPRRTRRIAGRPVFTGAKRERGKVCAAAFVPPAAVLARLRITPRQLQHLPREGVKVQNVLDHIST